MEELIFWNWAITPNKRRANKGNVPKRNDDAAVLPLPALEGGGGDLAGLGGDWLEQELAVALRPHLRGSCSTWVMLIRNGWMRLVSFNRLHRHSFSVLITFFSGLQHELGGVPVVFRTPSHARRLFMHDALKLESPFAGAQMFNRTIAIIPKYT